MRKMKLPPYGALESYDTCVDAIGDGTLRGHFVASRANIEQANTAFNDATQTVTWCNLPRVPHGNPDVLIAGTLTKKNLMDLYTSYMVGTTGPSRDIYDALLTAAGGLCPFCGGLGHAWTLDHYLPKANFPAFSVHPGNLVPCCRDCNSGKNASFGAHSHEQALHPYLDHARFFEERWIVATAHRQDPILLKFECVPPGNWSGQDQDRVRYHFKSYKLAYRFSVQSGSEVAKLVQLRASILSNLSPASYRDYLLENANSRDFVLNGWSRTMYAALAAEHWFVETNFQDPNWHF